MEHFFTLSISDKEGTKRIAQDKAQFKSPMDAMQAYVAMTQRDGGYDHHFAECYGWTRDNGRNEQRERQWLITID